MGSPDEVITASFAAPAASWSIVVHGGAGDVRAEHLPLHVGGCEKAAAVAAEILRNGGSALDAVQRAVEVLEDDPRFNAGTGACLDSEGNIELDASIMDGDLRAGAVCALPPFRNPIAIARAVMDHGTHVMMASEGAARFAIDHGFERASAETMITKAARERWLVVRAQQQRESGGGTVGAVARDKNGKLAAATSTGGMVNKLPGRVGDSPIVGAGTYAENHVGACSTTGHGEAMIRVGLARTVIERLRAGSVPENAASESLRKMHEWTARHGGLIVVAPDGSFGIARTTRSMTWAAVTADANVSGS